MCACLHTCVYVLTHIFDTFLGTEHTHSVIYFYSQLKLVIAFMTSNNLILQTAADLIF